MERQFYDDSRLNSRELQGTGSTLLTLRVNVADMYNKYEDKGRNNGGPAGPRHCQMQFLKCKNSVHFVFEANAGVSAVCGKFYE